MAKGDDSASFAAAISAAAQIPDDLGEGATQDLPQMFQFPIPANEKLIDNEPAPDPKRISGLPKYKLRAHVGRFVIGPIVTGGYGKEETVVDDRDDSAAYEEIQNQCLDGKAILCWEKFNFLKDGAVIIAMKWMTKHAPEEYARMYDQSTSDDETDE